MPIIIQFTHFKTELHRLTNSQISLKILRHVLNSFELLKITKLIYDLSQFYLLLHQTYTQLIERSEFLTITLKQLYDRGQKHYNTSHYQKYQNEDKTHQLIIEKGIEAVNIYHQFSDGLIRPGACDETQRFSIISFDTSVNYLVTNDNHDEGDIIMRIISVLVDFHNSLLDLMENELNNNQNHTVSALKNLIKELTSKNISILQIANDNTGVISLNEKDCLWIEQLCQASLTTDEEQYFIASDSRLIFDFTYIQSQIIRTYLLYCRINYHHIIQKYQCHTKKEQTTTNVEHLDLDEKYLIRLSDEQLENEWNNHLKNVLLDKLYHGHNLLRQIALTLNNHSNDLSSIYLFEFVKITDHNNHDILQQLEQYEIKDFQLCHIDHIIKLYAESISGFQHLFTDIPSLLRIPIDTQLNNELIQKFNENLFIIDYNNDIEKIQQIIQTITEFLNELKTIEDILLQQSGQSLVETCQHLAIDNSILSYIPYRIKCENYVDLYIHLIRTRSNLQEQIFNIEEQQMKLWDENFNSYEQQDKQENRFHQYLNPQYDEQIFERKQNLNELNDWKLPIIDDTEELTTGLTYDNNLLDLDQSQDQQQMKSKIDSNKNIEYKSLMAINIKSIPCLSSVFIQQIHKYRTESSIESIIVNKAQKFTIIHPNGESKTYFWKSENFFEQLKKIFIDKKYDHNLFVVVDKNGMFVDLTKNNHCPAYQSPLEYHIIEKQNLIQIQFQFRTQISKYLITSKCNISTIIHHFLDVKQLKNLSSDIILCFFDEYGKCIDDLCTMDQKIITIFVTEETLNTSILYEFALQNNEGN
ncbi:unnamed protein product [Rotaria sp. Silwood2]|nr:unnamed protein product [Rotaria sp. Silwood2]CAF4496843.1 unnamed protein product [Rotaria sp. Silwood2]